MKFRQQFVVASLLLACIVLHESARAQQTNPVDRQVSNPLTDTPNVNPIAPEDDIKVRPRRVKDSGYVREGGDGDVVVYSEKQIAEGAEGKRVVTHTGNVDLRYGIYRLQADKISVYEETNEVIAEGNVIFDQGEDQRITGARAKWNYKSKLGSFEESTGFTNQTNDGTVVYFTASRVERVSLTEIIVRDGKFTSCEDSVPKWSFTADEASIKTNDRVKLIRPRFRIKDVPIIPLPYATIPIAKQDRRSGFLTPTFSFSPNKGLRFSTAFYQTLGESADVTWRGDIYSSRGIGFGFDLRTRANSRSYFNFGVYGVRDRIFGAKRSAATPDQGGTLVYAEGVHRFSNGFTAAADLRLTSNLAFRQVFSDGIQQVISPLEVSQAFLNKSWGNYTMNILTRSQVISIPNVRVKTNNFPGINFDKRPSRLSFFKHAYFSFDTSLEGVSRREAVDSLAQYRLATGGDPIVTPAIGQRFDIHPRIEVPVSTKYFTFTAAAAMRSIFYSDSLDGMRRVIGRNLLRTYGEVELDLRPVALARNFYRKDGRLRFRHTIEPYAIYRLRRGVEDFYRTIRFDYRDTITDTNEFEFGLTNRFFTRKYPGVASREAIKRIAANSVNSENSPDVQPYEILVVTIRGKYFVDPYFGGALIAGLRNQIAPITDLTAFTFGGIPRRFSPLNFDVTYRPRRTVFANTRFDFGVQGDGLRNVSVTLGYDTSLVKVFQTFYYTKAVTLLPSLQKFNNPFGKEAGTLRGSQWNPSIMLGNRNQGWYGGSSLFFDFQNRRERRDYPLISSLLTVGYAYDCCALTLQTYTFNVGVRRENRVLFGFRLNGIGTFGTEQFGQGPR